MPITRTSQTCDCLHIFTLGCEREVYWSTMLITRTTLSCGCLYISTFGCVNRNHLDIDYINNIAMYWFFPPMFTWGRSWFEFQYDPTPFVTLSILFDAKWLFHRGRDCLEADTKTKTTIRMKHCTKNIDPYLHCYWIQ